MPACLLTTRRWTHRLHVGGLPVSFEQACQHARHPPANAEQRLDATKLNHTGVTLVQHKAGRLDVLCYGCRSRNALVHVSLQWGRLQSSLKLAWWLARYSPADPRQIFHQTRDVQAKHPHLAVFAHDSPATRTSRSVCLRRASES